MKAIILAAGRGSRLGHLTHQKPKCLVTLQNKPLLSYQIEALQAAGIKDIAIVCGYAKDMLQDERIRVKFENHRWQETNMVKSLLAAEPYLAKDDCIISYSDIFYAASAIRSLITCNSDIAITYDPHFMNLWSQRFENPLADLETFTINTQGTLLSIGERAQNKADIQGQYMGLLKINPYGFAQIKELISSLSESDLDRLDMTSLLQQLITKRVAIEAIRYNGTWGEVDHQSDLELYERWPLDTLLAS